MPPSINNNGKENMTDKTAVIPAGSKDKYVPAPALVAWLTGEKGRAAHFQRVDPILHAPIISKILAGRIPVTFEYAVRMARAQKPSATPFTADEIMTYEEDKQLFRYVSGQEPAPVVAPHIRAKPQPKAAA